MVHAASQEMVAMTGHLPRLAQQQTSSFKHPEQASAVRLSRANACPLYPHFIFHVAAAKADTHSSTTKLWTHLCDK